MRKETSKTCTKCGKFKELCEFYKNKNSSDGLQSQCKDCDKEYKKANKVNITIYKAEYRRVNKEAIAKYRKQNREVSTLKKAEYYENNKKSIAVKASKYFKTPRGKAVQKNAKHKRRALVKSGSTTTEQLQNLISNNPKCLYCKCLITANNRNIDHFIPLSKGGLHDISNLVIACATCNKRKGGKLPHVFIKQLGGNAAVVYEEDYLDW